MRPGHRRRPPRRAAWTGSWRARGSAPWPRARRGRAERPGASTSRKFPSHPGSHRERYFPFGGPVKSAHNRGMDPISPLEQTLHAARALVLADLVAGEVAEADVVSLVEDSVTQRRWWVEQWPDGA